MTSAFADQNLAHTSTPGLFVNYTIPPTQGWVSLRKPTLFSFTRSAAAPKTIIKWLGSRLLYNFCGGNGKRIMLEAEPIRLFGEKGVAEKARVILYTKPGCHLCDEMKREIQRAGCAELYALVEVNIETDADLLARYGLGIPVLLIDGLEVFRHRLRAADFKARLTGRQS
jgi:hypothetical protein